MNERIAADTIKGWPYVGVKTNKYRAKKVVTSEGTFDSQLEYRRWCDLKLLEKSGQIKNLERQIEYLLEVNGVKIGKYTLDHRYEENGEVVCEDVKGGVYSRDWPLRKKLMRAIFGIDVREWPERKRKKRKAKLA